MDGNVRCGCVARLGTSKNSLLMLQSILYPHSGYILAPGTDLNALDEAALNPSFTI